jgi:hypothetical protein
MTCFKVAKRSCCAVHAAVGLRRDVHVDDAASVVRQHDEHKQHAARARQSPRCDAYSPSVLLSPPVVGAAHR